MISSPVEGTPSNPNARYYAMAEQYKSYLCTGLGAGQLLFGLITAISIFPMTIVAGVLQVVSGLIVLSIEAPTLISPFLPQLQPIAAIVENRPAWQKIALYSGLLLVPFITGCFGFFFILGQLCAIGLVAVYALIYLGQKQNVNEMSYQQNDDQMGQQYPASP